MSGYTVKIAEFAIGDADIGGIHVAVDDPGNFAIGLLLLAQLIACVH